MHFSNSFKTIDYPSLKFLTLLLYYSMESKIRFAGQAHIQKVRYFFKFWEW